MSLTGTTNLGLSLTAVAACGWLLAGAVGVFAQEGQPANEVEGKTESKTQADTEAEAKPDPQQSDTEAEGQGNVESKTEAKTQQKQDASAEPSEKQGKAEQQSEIDADVKARQDAETKAEELQQPRGEAEAEGQTEARGEAEAETRPQQEGRSRQGQPRGQSELEGRSRTRGDANLGLQFEGDSEDGLVISNVAGNSLAAEAGLRPGDRIISVDERRFSSQGELNAYLRQRAGQEVGIVVHRDGRPQTVFLTPEFAEPGPGIDGRGRFGPPRRQTYRPPQVERQGALGVTLREGRTGVLLSAVHRGSPAFRAGLRPGDEIAVVNGRRVCGADGLISTLRPITPGEPVALGFYRNGQYQSAEVRLAQWEQAFAGEPIPMFGERRLAERRRDGRFETGAEIRRAPSEGEAEVPGPPEPPLEGRDGRQTARGPNSGQSRTALRPDFETSSRIEEMQKQIDSLKQEVDSLRNQVQQLRGERPSGPEEDTLPVPPEQAPDDDATQDVPGTSPEKNQESDQQQDLDQENDDSSNPDKPESGV